MNKGPMSGWLHALDEAFQTVSIALNVFLQRRRADVERVLGYPRLRRRFKRQVGYVPDFDLPTTMNEKINWRKLHDRAAVYQVIADKVRLRDYLVARFGAEWADAVLPRRRLVTKHPTAMNLAAAGTGVAIKPNHGSGWVRIVPGTATPDWQLIAKEARLWLRKRYGLRQIEWAYWAIEPQIMVEELVLGADGQPAQDVKFAVMDGVCVYIFVEQDRFGDHRLSYYEPDWTPLHLAMGSNPVAAHQTAPRFLAEMRDFAEEIGRDFDYIRVDFLCGAQEWKLNELTMYRSSGLAAFDPAHLDLHFGKTWKHRPYQGIWKAK